MTTFSKNLGEAWPLWPPLATPMLFSSSLGVDIKNTTSLYCRSGVGNLLLTACRLYKPFTVLTNVFSYKPRPVFLLMEYKMDMWNVKLPRAIRNRLACQVAYVP